MQRRCFSSKAVLQETQLADTTQVTPRLRVGVVLVGLFIGALGLWLASTLGASLGVQVLVLMAATYTGTWVAILVGRVLLRRLRHAGTETK
jgi:hypothetical protein